MVTKTADGSLRFRIFLPQAVRVELAGNFTEWSDAAIPMKRDADGWWETSTEVKPGDHEFSYRVDNGDKWLADFAAHGLRRNEFGGWVSLLSIEPKTRPASSAAAA